MEDIFGSDDDGDDFFTTPSPSKKAGKKEEKKEPTAAQKSETTASKLMNNNDDDDVRYATHKRLEFLHFHFHFFIFLFYFFIIFKRVINLLFNYLLDFLRETWKMMLILYFLCVLFDVERGSRTHKNQWKLVF